MERTFSARETRRYRRFRMISAEYRELQRIRDSGDRHTAALMRRGDRFAAKLRGYSTRGSITGDFWFAAAYWAQIEVKRAMTRLERALEKIQRLRELNRDHDPDLRLTAYNVCLLVETFEWVNALSDVDARKRNDRRFLKLVAEIAGDAEPL